ncbi:pyruvate carboxylase [Alicyclobacillaceae bacterium I2511]|nr:pyruvate carboxylase [Alicyclobacillaceae bacterium I2511]
MSRFHKILAANRGEVAIRICRACTELGIQTVAVYTKEDNLSLHRYKADEAYLIGSGMGPVQAYLDIETIIEVAQRSGCDAIHPGYGFLSESEDFAEACAVAGLAFIGPKPEHLAMFGDKVSARSVAIAAGIPVVPGTEGPVDLAGAREFSSRVGYPVMIKAVSGGGGRGMREVKCEADLVEAFTRATSEAQSSFGQASVYVEKYIESPKHIEVQILGDNQGNLVHLYERDCSIQRRHQKVVEMAPSQLPVDLREDICNTAVHLMQNVGYVNAGTVEFLLTPEGEFYFIEVNPRVQVEHTVTEMITGVDIVQAQIRIAEGEPLSSPDIGIPTQDAVQTRGYAIQCRVTTEDPQNGFLPDIGRILAYRSAVGFGIRLDAGNGYTGARILPYYDSLLVKITASGLRFTAAAAKMSRALEEFRIRGVKTNIPFLENVVRHPQFLEGDCDVNFIDTHPELFYFRQRRDRATKLLRYIGEVSINGLGGKGIQVKPRFQPAPIPHFSYGTKVPRGSRDLLKEMGTTEFLRFLHDSHRLWLTDTTFRDAHQSLLATRVRTKDLLAIAEATAHYGSNLFSMEMWGGATFDASMRFLREDPWDRLSALRAAIPNILFQMLLRGANAVGYKNYPDNVVQRFVRRAADNGIDIFRIFDSLNWLPNMQLALDEVRSAGKIAEAAICYTGDILNPSRSKYNLNYYVKLAQELERAGAQVLAIKDMAGLLKPYAATELVKALRNHVSLPIHLHTHDTSGNGMGTYLKAVEAGVNVVDVAISAMAGGTSQPSWNSLGAALERTDREIPDDLGNLQKLTDYWEVVRTYYKAFESGLTTSTADVYRFEMPGGQYSNLREQAQALGIGNQWEAVKEAYRQANNILGDIVKVTPSSKMVGDFALFMVQNQLTPETLRERINSLDFPASMVDYFMGLMGQPYGGFPDWLQQGVLKGRSPLSDRPGVSLPSVDFVGERVKLAERIGEQPREEDLLSYALYPQVTLDLFESEAQYSDLSVLDTPTYLYGLTPGEETTLSLEPGKTLIIKLLSIGGVHADGTRTVFFELNGQPREIEVLDKTTAGDRIVQRKASPTNPKEIGALMPGTVVSVTVKPGDSVCKGDFLVVTEAMKMEMQVQSTVDGVVQEVCCQPGDSVKPGDLLVVMA